MTVRLTPRAALVDWTLFVLVLALAATGLLTGVAGVPSDEWVFVAHGSLAVMFAVVVTWKLRRVAHRLRPREWQEGTATSVLLVTLALLALASGIAWTWGAPVWVDTVSVVTVHAVLGLLVIPAVALHLRHRYHGLDTTDLDGRRTALRLLGVGAAGWIGWQVQRTLAASVGVVTRFTRSRERGRFSGNDFPRTDWVADDPNPIDAATWELTIRGAVDTPQTYAEPDLDPEAASTEATLDCTSGWYTVQEWHGMRVSDLIDTADPHPSARYVSIVSITGYRWTYPIDEADQLLLATHVGSDRISHDHGYPLRLVAPGHRGYRWVKWIDHIELRRTRDLGKWVAIFVSGFD